MCIGGMDNGEWMMRAQREAMQQANPYMHGLAAAHASVMPTTSIAEDTTGLRLLDEFLDKRRQTRGGRDGTKGRAPDGDRGNAP